MASRPTTSGCGVSTLLFSADSILAPKGILTPMYVRFKSALKQVTVHSVTVSILRSVPTAQAGRLGLHEHINKTISKGFLVFV